SRSLPDLCSDFQGLARSKERRGVRHLRGGIGIRPHPDLVGIGGGLVFPARPRLHLGHRDLAVILAPRHTPAFFSPSLKFPSVDPGKSGNYPVQGGLPLYFAKARTIS